MPRKKTTLEQFRKDSLKKVQAAIGTPTFPDWNDRRQYWVMKKKMAVPRSFQYVFDIKHDCCILAQGMSLLGFEDEQFLTSDQLISIMHDNHKNLFAYQICRVQEAFVTFTQAELGFDYYTAGFRAIRDKDGRYWLTYSISEVFQYDENGVPCRHLTWSLILAPYHGYPFYIEFFHRDGKKSHRPLQEMMKKLRNIKIDQLKILGFTRTQLEVLRNYSDEHSIPRVAELMDVDKRTIEKHNRNIIKLAKQNFPLNQFDNYKDVVNYLVRQGLI